MSSLFKNQKHINHLKDMFGVWTPVYFNETFAISENHTLLQTREIIRAQKHITAWKNRRNVDVWSGIDINNTKTSTMFKKSEQKSLKTDQYFTSFRKPLFYFISLLIIESINWRKLPSDRFRFGDHFNVTFIPYDTSPSSLLKNSGHFGMWEFSLLVLHFSAFRIWDLIQFVNYLKTLRKSRGLLQSYIEWWSTIRY